MSLLPGFTRRHHPPLLLVPTARRVLGVCVSRGATPSVDDVAEALPLHNYQMRNTVVLQLLWIVWKSRNRMTIDNCDQDRITMLATVATHAHLWQSERPARLNPSARLLLCNNAEC